MFRRKLARLGTVLAASLFVAMVIGPTVVSAANTRLLYVGDPALVNCNPMTFSTGETYNTTCPTYLVHPTAVSVGNTSYFDVLLKNLGKQTLTSATLGFGDLIADDNGAAGPQLPAGWTIVSYTSLTGTAPTCTTNGTAGAYTGLSCNFGNLGRGASASIRIVVRAGSTRDHESTCVDTLTDFTLTPCPALVVSGKVAEAVGGNVGSNNNTFYAYGDEPSSDFPNHVVTDYYVTGDGRVAGLFDKNHGPITPDVQSGITTSVDLFALTSTSEFVVSIDETTAGPSCPTTITTCSPGASTVHVNQGNNVSPYFVWVAQFPVGSTYKLSTKTGFIHFFETYDPILHPNDYETFYNVNKTSCSKPGIPCADFSLVNGGAADAYVEIYFKTAKNGSGKLF